MVLVVRVKTLGLSEAFIHVTAHMDGDFLSSDMID